MSDSGSKPYRSAVPQAALDALLTDATGGGVPMVRRALWLDEFDHRLRPLLPPSLATHARLANIDGDTLVLLVDSPIWHARVRLAASDILDAARSLGLDVTRLVVRTTRNMPIAPARSGQTATPPGASIAATANQSVRDALASLRDADDASTSDKS